MISNNPFVAINAILSGQATDTLLQDVQAIAPMLVQRDATAAEYNDSTGVWNDNGSSNVDTSILAGTAPALIAWEGNFALDFDGTKALRAGLVADNIDLLNTQNTVIIVGEFSVNGHFIDNGSFRFNGVATISDGAPNYDHGGYVNVPFLCMVSAGIPIDEVPEVRNLFYVNGDWTLRIGFTSNAIGDVQYGRFSTNFMTGQLAYVGVTEGTLTNNQRLKIINRINQKYTFNDVSENHITYVGDSNTFGFGLTVAQSWPVLINAELETDNPTLTFRYYNGSVGGFTLESAINITQVNEFNMVLTDGRNLDLRVLIVALGTNDFVTGGTTSAEGIGFITDLVDNALAAGYRKILLCTVFDRTAWWTDATRTVETANGTQKSGFNTNLLAFDFTSRETAYGADIRVIDLASVVGLDDFTNTTFFQGDGIHLTAAGQQLIVDTIKPVYELIRVVDLADDTSAPVFSSFTLSPDNAFVDVTFNKGLFSSDDFDLLSVADFQITNKTNFGGAGASDVAFVSLKRQDNTDESLASGVYGNDIHVRFFLNVTGDSDGTETFEIQPLSATAVNDVFGNNMLAAATTGTITLTAAGLSALTMTVEAGTGNGVTITGGNNVTCVGGNASTGLRTDSKIRSTEAVPTDQDWEVQFEWNKSLDDQGFINMHVGNFGVTLGSIDGQLNYATNRNGSPITTGSVPYADNRLYRILYTSANTTALIDYSVDSGANWINISTFTNVTVITYPAQFAIEGALFGADGTHTINNIVGTANFTTT